VTDLFGINDLLFEFGIREIAHRRKRNDTYTKLKFDESLLFFSARHMRVKALVKSKGLFLNPSLRRLGIVALRTIEVLERR